MRFLEWQITVVVSLAPRQIDRGDVKWPYTLRQKQGSTEAGPVGRKRYVFALFLNSIITLVCNNCQIYKKSNTFAIRDKLISIRLLIKYPDSCLKQPCASQKSMDLHIFSVRSSTMSTTEQASIYDEVGSRLHMKSDM